jgi:hypothetical protein
VTQQIINIGTVANDGTGDPARTAFTKTNSNFSDIYSTIGVSGGGVVNITCGSIDATTIGVNTPAAGGFTTLVSTAVVQSGPSSAVTAGGSTAVGFTATTTANLGLFFGSGAPTLSAAKGSLYVRTDGSSTSTRLYVNSNGTTGWTNVVTAT